MNGVRKNSGVIRLLMAAALVLFVAACSSGSGVKNDRDMYRDMAAELTTELEMVKAQLDMVTGERDQAQSDLMGAQGMVSDLDGQVSDLNGQISDLNGQISDLDGQVSDLDGQVSDLDGQVSDLDGQVSDLNGQVSDLDGQVSDLDGQVSDLTTMRDSLTTMRDSLQMQVNTLTEQAGADGMTISDLNDQIAGLDDQITGLDDQITGLDDQITGLNGQITDLDGQITGLNGMITDLNGQITGLNGMITDLNGQITSLDGQITGLNGQITDLETERDSAKTRVTELEGLLAAADAELKRVMAEADAAKAKADAMAATEDAKKLFNAIEKADVDGETDPTVSVTASSAGVVTAKSGDFTEAGYDAISGRLRGKMLTDGTEVIAVYTDIENATPTPIGNIYRSAADPGKPGVYTLSELGTGDTIKWSDAKRTDDQHVTTAGDTDPTTTFKGSVRGLSGTFSCTASNCVPTPAKDAIDVSTATGWTFAPDSAGANIDVMDDDGYLMFGWWLDKGKTAFSVATFHGAVGADGMPATANSAAAADEIEGTATYSGGAAGKFAILSTVEDSAKGGHFTARANLIVNFDARRDEQPDNVDTEYVSVNGTIDNFMTFSGPDATDRTNWEVTLEQDAANYGTEIASTGTTEWETGGAVPGKGTWTGSFYGGDNETAPSSVTGTFDAAIGEVARIVGAFGASAPEEE